jgi:hypothetical protein
MIELNKMILKYSELTKNNKSLSNEIAFLEKISKEYCTETNEEWIRLSDNEKKIKRILLLKTFRKTEGYHNGVFEIEERIIDLYEAIENVLIKLNVGASEFLIIRLQVYLLLIKKIINCNRDIRKVKDFYLKELQSIISDCVNSQ